MPREKKDGRYINYKIRRDLYEMLEKYAPNYLKRIEFKSSST